MYFSMNNEQILHRRYRTSLDENIMSEGRSLLSQSYDVRWVKRIVIGLKAEENYVLNKLAIEARDLSLYYQDKQKKKFGR